MSNFLSRFAREEDAVTAIEYGLIAALIAVTIIVLLSGAGLALNTIWTKIANCLSSPSTC